MCRLERDESVTRAMEAGGFDLLVCALPMNILMLTGYCPVVGASIALADRNGDFILVVPSDEQEIAEESWADDILCFEAGSLDRIVSVPQAACGAFKKAFDSLTQKPAVIGVEAGDYSQPAPYVGLHLYSGSLDWLISQAAPGVQQKPAGDVLSQLRAVKSRAEIEHIRSACTLAETAYTTTRGKLAPGLTEKEAAALGTAALSLCGGNARCEGSMFCMSGPNAAKAYAAYQKSTTRQLTKGDLVLVHVNSHVNGYWTDVTRTYCFGEPDERQRAMYDTTLAARMAALQAIRPGVKASDVDRAARSVMDQRGFGKAFRHPTGHGVGFVAIDHNAKPRIHPLSQETLETGMVFNVEPGIYIEGYGGMRHCDMVAVTETGYDLLTSFHQDLKDLLLAA